MIDREDRNQPLESLSQNMTLLGWIIDKKWWVITPIIIIVCLTLLVLFIGRNEGITWSNGLYGIGE